MKKRVELSEMKRARKREGFEFVKADAERGSPDLILFEGNICGAPVTAAAMLVTLPKEPGDLKSPTAYRFAYAICSVRDYADLREGLSLVGWRIQVRDEPDHPYTFQINLSSGGALNPTTLCAFARIHIEMDILAKRVRVPQRLYRACVAGSFSSHMRRVERLNFKRRSNKAVKIAGRLLH
jgi:hypothetical protein